jgi:hypothetical protein
MALLRAPRDLRQLWLRGTRRGYVLTAEVPPDMR